MSLMGPVETREFDGIPYKEYGLCWISIDSETGIPCKTYNVIKHEILIALFREKLQRPSPDIS